MFEERYREYEPQARLSIHGSKSSLKQYISDKKFKAAAKMLLIQCSTLNVNTGISR